MTFDALRHPHLEQGLGHVAFEIRHDEALLSRLKDNSQALEHLCTCQVHAVYRLSVYDDIPDRLATLLPHIDGSIQKLGKLSRIGEAKGLVDPDDNGFGNYIGLGEVPHIAEGSVRQLPEHREVWIRDSKNRHEQREHKANEQTLLDGKRQGHDKSDQHDHELRRVSIPRVDKVTLAAQVPAGLNYDGRKGRERHMFDDRGQEQNGKAHHH
mmetsp:Transcript_1300/g.3527  ORF Transcript_1300/g.3527 Transcript_1300/m.3527 type:complete len:211 (-) Transcript_1300:261-893(-)